MRVLKAIGKGVLALVAILVIALFGLYLTNPTYYGRFARVLFIDPVRDVDFYAPLEVVKGGPGEPFARAPETARSISAEGWQTALDYAKQMDSTALVVWQGGQIQYEYYKPGFNPTDRTDPASMHKSITALVVGLAIADGKIRSVDEPASTYISEWQNDARNKITIRNLLTMTSGLAREPFSPSPMSQTMQLNLGTDLTSLILKVPAGDEPGKIFAYYNVNSELLGLIIERATGKRYAEYLSEKLWSRIGARDARVFLDHEGGLARTFCCIQMSAEDWLRVGLLHLNMGKVGDVEVVPQAWMTMVRTPSAVNPNYGFQTWLGTTYEAKRSYGKGVASYGPHSEPFAVSDMIYFDGAGGQRVYIVPSKQMVIVRTGAAAIDFKTGAFKWDDAIVPNALIRGLRASDAVPAAAPDAKE